ncbi:MAG TPA: 50S ribosomal protein L18 [Pyrinomonadaceae bacterium]|nr:50S ribosomal protein L18 [Pyrinomonadaceae bacterium]
MANRNRAEVRNAVHSRIRRKVRGTTERPRLAVYRSLNHIYAQVIDDQKSQTLASASTTEKGLGVAKGGNIDAAKRVGQAIAERALAAGIESVVFDRGGYLYHGRVQALTDAARAAGLNKNEVVEAEAAEAEKPEAAEAEPAKPKGKQKEPKAKAKKEAAPEEATTEAGAGDAGAKPRAKKEKAPKEDAGAGEATADPKARKEKAPKQAKDAEAGSPPEKADLKDSKDGGSEAG